jgi:hypothetical protein
LPEKLLVNTCRKDPGHVKAMEDDKDEEGPQRPEQSTLDLQAE